MTAETIVTHNGPLPIAEWERLESQVECGMVVLKNGDHVITVEELRARTAEIRELFSPAFFDTWEFVRAEREVTARHLADRKGLKMTTAAMRLHRGFDLGLYTRYKSPDVKNEYTYKIRKRK